MTSETKYKLRTDDGLSGEYTLEALKAKSSIGDFDESVECTPDDGDTWVSLRTLIMQSEVLSRPGATLSGISPAASNASADPLPANSQPRPEPEPPVSGLRRLRRVSASTSMASGTASRPQMPPTKRQITSPDDLVGESLAGGRYQVISKLGNGSMAYVLRATDSRLNTDVVVKVPKPEKMTDRDIRERFLRESQLMVELTHPHVVKVLDVGEHLDLPYVIMQLLSGGSLTDRIRQATEAGQPLTADSLKTWLREVARALDFCCRKGTIHRDVKPANILFDDDGNAYVSDFGLTKIMYGEHTSMDPSDTAAGVVLGTPNYIAPEIILGHQYDGRADQYSLGITAYHSLFGRPPMQGDSATATMINQTQKQLQLLSDFRSDVPRELALAIRKSIEKDPKNRFATCEEFAEAAIEGLKKPAGTTVVPVAAIQQNTPPRPKRRSEGPSSQSSARRRRPRAAQLPAPVQEPEYLADDDWLHESPPQLPSRSAKTRSASGRPKSAGKPSSAETVLFGQKINPVVVIAGAVAVMALVVSVLVSKLSGTDAEAEMAGADGSATVSIPTDTTAVNPRTRNAGDDGLKTRRPGPGKQQKNEPSESNAVASKGGQKNNGNAASKAKTDTVSQSAASQSTVPTAKVTQVSQSRNVTEPDRPDPAKELFPPSSSAVPLELKYNPSVTFGEPQCPVFVSGRQVFHKADGKVQAQLSESYPDDAVTAISPDGRYFAASLKAANQENSDVAVWETATGKRTCLAKGKVGQFADIVLLSNTQLFVGSRFLDELTAWDAASGSARKSLRINGAKLRHGGICFSPDAQFVAVASDSSLAVLKTAGAKPVALMQPPPDRPKSGPPRRNNAADPKVLSEIYASLRDLKFSPDGQFLAAIATHPTPRFLCWNSRGELTTDSELRIPSDSPATQKLEWFSNGNSVLVGLTIIDRQTGRTLALTDVLTESLHIYDDTHLFGRLPAQGGKPARIEIPWDAIKDAAEKIDDSSAAYIAPGTSVSIAVEGLEDRKPVEILLRKIITAQISANGLTAAEGQPFLLKVSCISDKQSLSIRLLNSSTKDELWQREIPVGRAISDEWKSLDADQRDRMLADLERRLFSVSIPYLVLKTTPTTTLPFQIR